MKINERLYITLGKASKHVGDVCVKPILGYNWFYFLPHFHWNKGNPFKKQVVDVSFSWFIFWLGITLWPKWVCKKENQADTLKVTNHPLNQYNAE